MKMESPDKKNQEFNVSENWNEQSKILMKNFSQLTHDDVKLEKGKEHELLKRIQTKLNKEREEVIQIINESKPKPVE